MEVQCFLSLICVGVFVRSNWNPVAFATDDGIFRYKRLGFGVNAAQEKYQHIITQTIAGLKGVANIADDLVVHGQDSEKRDRNLIKVLERLKKR